MDRKNLRSYKVNCMLHFQVIKHVNASIPESFVLLLLNPESAIMKLRFCADEEVPV